MCLLRCAVFLSCLFPLTVFVVLVFLFACLVGCLLVIIGLSVVVVADVCFLVCNTFRSLSFCLCVSVCCVVLIFCVCLFVVVCLELVCFCFCV